MRPLRILVAEDDAVIAALLVEVLAGLGHGVCETVSSEQGAVVAAMRLQPDLMIMDVHLTPGSGIAAVATISLVRFIPHLFMTAGAAQAVDSHTTLQKPFREADIVWAIERTMHGASARSTTRHSAEPFSSSIR